VVCDARFATPPVSGSSCSIGHGGGSGHGLQQRHGERSEGGDVDEDNLCAKHDGRNFAF
jgi:hypothetical protein